MASPGDLAGVLSCSPVTSSSWAAKPGEYVRTDATHGSLTVTLPNSPPMHSVIGVKQIAVSGTNVTTVVCSGADAFNMHGGNTSLTLPMLNQGATFTYKSGIWLLTAGNLPLTGLDARYAPASTGQAPSVTYYSTPGTFTWTPPVGAAWVQVFLIGGGAGGGSGASGDATAQRT